MVLYVICVLIALFITVSGIGTDSPYYVGCFIDGDERQLKGFSIRTYVVTPSYCIGLCQAKGFPLAGMEAGNECFCGKSLKEDSGVEDRECLDPCIGDSRYMCGGAWRLSVYRTFAPNDGFNAVNSSYVGCFVDSSSRLLGSHVFRNDLMTPEFCVNQCKMKGYRLAGIEVGIECFCGDTTEGAVPVADSDCSIDCVGDKSLKCGSHWRLSVYRTGFSGSGVNPVGPNYIGCYIDDSNRQLNGAYEKNTMMRPDLCVNFCYKKGFSLAALEVGEECYCGDSLKKDTRVDDSECIIPCSGDNTLMCGSNWRLSVYRTLTIGRGFNPVQSNYVGCFSDSKARQLNGAAIVTKLLTPLYCVNFCYDRGFHLAGLLKGLNCYCGDILKESTEVKKNECNRGCAGDLSLTCGSDDRLDVYKTKLDYEPVSYYIGCFEENVEDRFFTGLSFDSGSLTIDHCVGFCYRRGYRFAGTQYGEGCVCSNSLKQRDRVDFNECSIPCSGDENQKCGGHWRISVYKTGIVFDDKNADGHLIGRNYVGCYKDTPDRQIISARREPSHLMTQDMCSSFCYRKGFRLAGIENGEECFCGDNLREGTVLDDKECYRVCIPDDKPRCGGIWRLSVIRTLIPDNILNSYYVGCFEENKNERVKLLNGLSKELVSMTIDSCVGFCLRRGFLYAGMKNGGTCNCGDTLNQRNGIANSKCDSKCSGDKTEFCGGDSKYSVYRTRIDVSNRADRKTCERSNSTVNGKAACKREVLFEEDFNSGFVDNFKWSYSKYMPSVPDNEFIVFGDRATNIYVKDGVLHIKPTLSNHGSLLNGQINVKDCTGQQGGVECFRQAVYYFILPPIESSRIHTKNTFSFRYGKVQITAKMPLGDWIVPELWLLPKSDSYGSYYSSGKIRLAMARGNEDLKLGKDDLGNSELECGVLMGVGDDIQGRVTKWHEGEGWSNKFHNFTFQWTPDNLSFSVDDSTPVDLITPPGGRLSDQIDFKSRPPKSWNKGSNIAPFDKEFYLSFGLSVGGTRDFPDGSSGKDYPKPWNDSDAKAMLHFWQAKDNWFGTWKGEESTLQIDHIKVTAL